EVSDILKEKGYQEILTDNADNFDYETSELQVKKSMSQVKSPFKQDLKEYVTSFKESTLNEDEAADIVIIIGSDFK
ncbi:LytR C-terminal domain-containing protein, partial [Candidatus Roizmanbacteria bacterium]|nr:LytR C-terminal domain-containing protein [Candidatus Roizmanbacteria bacterium]